MKYIVNYLAPFCLILMLSTLAFAQASGGFPLVIVVHGIGGGNAEDGWSRKYAEAWGVEAHEVTFRYEGRTSAISYEDFGRKAGDWVLDAQSQIKDIIRKNPGRRVIIVSHSWGTVITKMALDGGIGGGSSDTLGIKGYNIPPIELGDVEIEELVTLASPMGSDRIQSVAHVEVPDGQPKFVKHWTNFYDIADEVSSESHDLKGANNVKLDSGKSSFRAHTDIWTDPVVRQYIWDSALRISNMPRLPATRVGVVTGPPPVDRRRTDPGPTSGGSSDERIVAEYQSLLPAVLEKNKKPWHTRINIIANAAPQGAGYRVNYQTYCLIEQGPDKGKDYVCFEFDTVLDLGGVKSAVADMRRQLGR